KVNRQKQETGSHYDWLLFNNKIKVLDKRTFIFKNNSLLRMKRYENTLHFLYIEFEQLPDHPKGVGIAHASMFYIETETGKLSENFGRAEVQKVEQMVYKLLCFMYLTDNEEIYLDVGRKVGT